MKQADQCVLLLPCGRSAHFEAGWFWGQNKPVHILLVETEVTPELMYLGATSICTNTVEVVDAINAAETMQSLMKF